MLLRFLVAKVVSEAVFDKPLAEIGSVVKFVFDDLQSIRKEERHSGQASCDFVVKAAC